VSSGPLRRLLTVSAQNRGTDVWPQLKEGPVGGNCAEAKPGVCCPSRGVAVASQETCLGGCGPQSMSTCWGSGMVAHIVPRFVGSKG
jgi:hypothetical protein